jgi:MFS family permease
VNETTVVAPTNATAAGGGWFSRLRQLEQPTEDLPGNRLRTILVVMGLPTLGLAFSISIITTYGPVVLLVVAHSTTKVGLLIGGEGAFALVVPLISGALSDRIPPGRFGRRLPFVMIGGPLVMAGLILLPLSATYLVASIAILMFYVGYYLFYPPYRAIYADVLPRDLYARSQASQAILRGAGLGAALLAGGLLLGLWRELPFVVAAVLLGVTGMALWPVSQLSEEGDADLGADATSSSVRQLLLHNRRMQIFAVANSLWEFSFAGLKSFMVLYVVHGTGQSPAMASLVIAVVAVAYVTGAPIAARLAGRFGMVRVMFWAAAFFGIGLCYGVFPTTLTPMIVALPVVALAGSVLLTLPQALAFLCAPDGGQGIAAGLVDVSRGVGLVLGPIAVGAAIGSFSGVFGATHGYAAMWPVIGIANLVSLPLLYRLRDVPGG